jgi:hypothetical protein
VEDAIDELLAPRRKPERDERWREGAGEEHGGAQRRAWRDQRDQRP